MEIIIIYYYEQIDNMYIVYVYINNVTIDKY